MIDYDALELVRSDSIFLKKNFPSLNDNYVAGEGDNPAALIIGEAPGAAEDIKRRPFVGAAGQVLRQLMDLADLQAESRSYADISDPPNCWLTNVVKFRPPKNRDPTHEEIKAFRPLIVNEWEAVGSPNLIIPVGSIALKAVTGKTTSILRAAGKHHVYIGGKGRKLHIWPMVHPAFGLRNKAVQPLLEQDWEALAAWRRRNEN